MPISQWPCQLGNGHANGRRTRRTNNQSASASGVHRGCIGHVRIGGVSGVCRGYISFFLKVFLRFPCSPPGPPPLPFWLKLFGVKLFGVFRSQARPCSFSPSAAMDETGPQRARDAELLRLGERLALRMIAQEDQAKAGNQPGSHQWWEQPSLQSRAHVGLRERAKAANAPPPPKTNPLLDQPGPQSRAHVAPRLRAKAAGFGKATPYQPVPVKAPPPPKTQMEAPPQRVNVPLPKESPPMPPREDTRHFFDDQPSLASTIPMDLEEDEPEPFRRRSKSDSWSFGSANGSCTVWPYKFNLLRRSYSDSCLWAVECPPAFLQQRHLLHASS